MPITTTKYNQNVSLQMVTFIIIIIEVIPFIDLFIILYYINEEDLQLPVEAVDNELNNSELVV